MFYFLCGKLSLGLVEHISKDYELASTGRTQGKNAPFLTNIFFSKLLVVVLRPVSVEELVSVEDAPSARFASFDIKTNILACQWF